nr:hypothetical protein [Staphylococcus haemolyticus]
MDDVTKYGPVDGDPIIEKEEIPFDKKREFDPKSRNKVAVSEGAAGSPPF